MRLAKLEHLRTEMKGTADRKGQSYNSPQSTQQKDSTARLPHPKHRATVYSFRPRYPSAERTAACGENCSPLGGVACVLCVSKALCGTHRRVLGLCSRENAGASTAPLVYPFLPSTTQRTGQPYRLCLPSTDRPAWANRCSLHVTAVLHSLYTSHFRAKGSHVAALTPDPGQSKARSSL